ncbi:unnamed protein product [Effrenium voratum]|nr:unnamed protein product [Effrenium voratum]
MAAEPLAWADGSTYTTPDQVPTGAWQVWITDDITVIGAGYWYGHPSLRVPGSIEPGWAFGLNPTSAMTNVGIDALMSLPYLTSATFDLGPATTAGTYKMCWCPTWDWPESEDLRGGDVDTTPCSSEPEFFVNNGMLAVGYLTIQSRYHCLLGSDCSIGLSLAALVNQRAVLFPGTASCSEADFSLASPWSAARNVSGAQPTANWSVFEFGNASSDGYYQICVCTNYDDGLDGMTCSRFSEFYEAAGSLTVAPEVSLLFEAGIAAVLNVSRGTGLAASDRLLYLPGLQCNVSSAGLSPVASPAQVEATGAWASYGLGAGGTELTSGLWVACLCTDFDGPDADQVACNDLAEFSVPVGKLKVTAVQGPQLQSSVSSSVVLRLTLSRRLSAVDAAVAALGYELAVALETALQRSLETFLGASPVSVRVTGVSPLRGTGSVDVTANFTATLSAAASDHLLEVRDFDNASCPVELLEPPWAQAAVPSAPSAELLLGCLRLAEALDAEGAAFQSVLDAELQSVAITGIASPQVVSFGQLQAPVLGYQPAEFRCARGGTCQIRVLAAAGVGTVPALGRLLVSGDSCGLQDGVPNAPAGLIANNPVDASSGTASSVRVVDTGAPELEGSFTLCYCAGGDSGRGACGSDLDYFSQVGTLIVRGPPANFDAFCVVFQDCQVLLRGVELSVWDRLLVKDGGSCYDSSAVGFQASSYFAVNPATLPEWKDSDEWIFDLGAASQTGVYQLCYCASYSATGSVPCQSPSDFTMQAGRLRVRGVQQSGLSFSCVKSSKGDGEAPCTLPPAMLRLECALLSGRSAQLQISGSASLRELRRRAAEALKATVVLVQSKEENFDESRSLEDAGLRDGGVVFLLAQRSRLASHRWARGFALLEGGDGQVRAWGDARHGGDCSKVQHLLRHVEDVKASGGAFAARLSTGAVVCWGDPDFGGDCGLVKHQLCEVRELQASLYAFAALKSDGSVVAWGDFGRGGHLDAAQEELQDVRQIQSSGRAFAAVCGDDGRVVTWGDPAYGGDRAQVPGLRKVRQVEATLYAFAAILEDGSVVTWGDPDYGGDCSEVRHQLVDVRDIKGSYLAFAALRSDDSVVTWGSPGYGGDSSAVCGVLSGVASLAASFAAFAALKRDGSVVTWGSDKFGGDSAAVQDQLLDVQQIKASSLAFAALTASTVVTWGQAEGGGDCSSVPASQLAAVESLEASGRAFAALTLDGAVVTWGDPAYGGAYTAP